MNKNRRKRIQKVIDQLFKLRLEVDSIKNIEEDALLSLPESLEESVQSDKMRAAVQELEEADADFENLMDQLKNSIA